MPHYSLFVLLYLYCNKTLSLFYKRCWLFFYFEKTLSDWIPSEDTILIKTMLSCNHLNNDWISLGWCYCWYTQHNKDDTIKTSDTVFRKIYLSLYLKGFCVRGSWRPNRTATYWPPHSIGHQRFFPVFKGCSTGGPGVQLSAGCWFSLPHLVSKTDWISCALSFIIVHAHSIFGMACLIVIERK